MDPEALSSIEVALSAALLLLGGLILETRVLPGRWVSGYHDVGLPLLVTLPPIHERPTGSGDTQSVAWVEHGGRVRFAARPGERRVPAGLHGVIRFRQTPKGQAMRVSWAPPWTFGLAVAWASAVAVTRGEGPVMVPMMLGIGAVIGWLYWTQARRVAIELRMAFSRRSTRSADPDRG